MTSTIDAPPAPGPRRPAVVQVPATHAGRTPHTEPDRRTEPSPRADPAPRTEPTAVRVVVRRLPPPGPVIEPHPLEQPEPPAPAPLEVPGNPQREITTLLRLMLEILDRRRPPSQLGGRLSPSVQRYLANAATRLNPPAVRRVAAARGRHGPPGLRTMRLSHPAGCVTEASARWEYRGRPRALAARFEWSADCWRCTALHLG